MAQHGVFGIADEGLDLQILLDPAEEDLDLPAFLVDVGDGLGCQPEVVGEEHVNFAGFGVLVNDAAQGLGALSGFSAGKQDGLIGHQSQGGVDGTPPQHPVAGIAFLPSDKEDFLDAELAIPGIVGIAQVLHDDGPLGEVKGPGFFHLMFPGRGDSHKGRQVAVVVQKGVELDPRFGAPKRGPGKKGQAEAHHGGVQAIELVFELELVTRSMGQAALIHEGEDGCEKTGGPPVVGVGKCRPGYGSHPQVVKVGKPGFQGRHPIPQAGPGGDLHEDEVHQLMPTAESTARTPGAVLPFQSGKMMSRNQFEHVMKDCVTMGHGPDSPVCLIGYG